MAKDAAKMRRFHHPIKDDVKNGALYLASLSESERERIYRFREYKTSAMSILYGLGFLLIPFLFIALWFG